MAGLCALMTFKKGNQLRARPALERFAEKCRFDPATGCVLWIGGTTAGRGNSALYGSFWFEGSRWFTHRWSAIHIHGIDLGDNQAGHCCPHGPNRFASSTSPDRHSLKISPSFTHARKPRWRNPQPSGNFTCSSSSGSSRRLRTLRQIPRRCRSTYRPVG
jgi:hypothetical protein